MRSKAVYHFFAFLLVLAVFLTACGEKPGNDTAELTEIVALTMTAIAAEPPPQPTAIPGDLHPLADNCAALKTGMESAIGQTVDSGSAPVTTSWSGETGSACQLTALTDGNKYGDIMQPLQSLKTLLESNGWLENSALSPCLGQGGAGPGANQNCFVQGDKTCETFVKFEPTDLSLCPTDKPIGECFETLVPEQKLYTVQLTCAEGLIGMPLPKTEPSRIQFEAGAASARVQARLGPGGLHPYVLGAMAGQEMIVTLNPAGSGILSIWGADSTALLTEGSRASNWRGILPASQDYYIDVISIAPAEFGYTLDVSISALGQINPIGQVYPRVEPFPARHMQVIRNTGVPAMLPASFPSDAGLPAIAPYPFTAAPGIYELSLDYGEQCQGAGACHYGMIAGMQTTFAAPVGTSNYPFDSALAQPVVLDRGITGYFVESVCGANCGDAIIWWVYGGYQYAVGLKAGPRDQVVALANAAINNSLP